MQRLILFRPGGVRLEPWDDPQPGPGEAVVRSELGLISAGTERLVYLGQLVPANVRDGFAELASDTQPLASLLYAVSPAGIPVLPAYPSVLGYNAVGFVEEVAPDVRGVSPGDRVMTLGRHSEKLLLPAWQAVPVPNGVPSEQAVFSYLATLGLHALRRAGFVPGENVVVVGLGVVGMAAACLAAACGGTVVGIEPNSFRRSVALSSGVFEAALDPDAPTFESALASAFESDHQVDLVIEAAGSAQALETAIRVAPRSGRVAVIALHPELPPGVLGDLFHEKGCMLIGCGNDPNVEPESKSHRFTLYGNVRFVLRLLARGRLSFAEMMTKVYPIDQAEAAYAELAGGQSFMGLGLAWGRRPGDDH